MGWSDLGDHRAMHALAAAEPDAVITQGPAFADTTRRAFIRSQWYPIATVFQFSPFKVFGPIRWVRSIK